MTYTSLIRSALPGIPIATAALLTAFMPSSASAARHADAQLSRPVAATHATETQRFIREAGIPCDTVDYTGNGQLAQIKQNLPFNATVANIRTGPSLSCTVLTQEQSGDSVTYFSTYGGFSFIMDNTDGETGWMANNNLDLEGVSPTGVAL